jgi:type IV pili sensor histidine kinase/response regulator
MPATQLLRRLTSSSLLITAALSSGCATTAAPPTDPAVEEAQAAPQTPELIPVARYDRYTLVELAPTAAQRDLLLQVIDVAIPADAWATVGDGLRHALRRSGYQLCENAHAVIELYLLPLPAAHLHLGPMTLHDALLTLAGPAWDVQVDDRARQICFVPAGEPSADPETDTPVATPVQIFPITDGGQL